MTVSDSGDRSALVSSSQLPAEETEEAVDERPISINTFHFRRGNRNTWSGHGGLSLA